MKKIIFFLLSLVGTINLQGQIKVTNVGNVGIGNNSPTYKFDVCGISRICPNGYPGIIFDKDATWGCSAIYGESNNNLWIGRSDRWLNHIWSYQIDYQNITQYSDERLKENIDSCSNVLPKIRKIISYTYNYKDCFFKDFTTKQKQRAQRKQFGFLAQKLKEIFPELVFQSDTGFMSVDYVEMVPILTTAINEQQMIIDAQSLKIKELDDRLTKVESKQDSKSSLKSASVSVNTDSLIQNALLQQSVKTTPINKDSIELSNTFLFQNSPNPFSKKTEIRYFISEGVKKASLMIFDMQGVLKKEISINIHGLGAIIIEGSELKAGMYIYSLIVDSQEIATKRMILTE